MLMKLFITLGVIIGSIIGGYIPALWDAGAFSAWAIITSTMSGIVGIWAGYKLAKYIDI